MGNTHMQNYGLNQTFDATQINIQTMPRERMKAYVRQEFMPEFNSYMDAVFSTQNRVNCRRDEGLPDFTQATVEPHDVRRDTTETTPYRNMIPVSGGYNSTTMAFALVEHYRNNRFNQGRTQEDDAIHMVNYSGEGFNPEDSKRGRATIEHLINENPDLPIKPIFVEEAEFTDFQRAKNAFGDEFKNTTGNIPLLGDHMKGAWHESLAEPMGVLWGDYTDSTEVNLLGHTTRNTGGFGNYCMEIPRSVYTMLPEIFGIPEHLLPVSMDTCVSAKGGGGKTESKLEQILRNKNAVEWTPKSGDTPNQIMEKEQDFFYTLDMVWMNMQEQLSTGDGTIDVEKLKRETGQDNPEFLRDVYQRLTMNANRLQGGVSMYDPNNQNGINEELEYENPFKNTPGANSLRSLFNIN